jgi:hypothetical protein
MEKYSKTYTQLANIILGLSDYQRSEILGIIHKFLRNQSSTPYYKRRRSNKSAALITMFILGFMGGIVFLVILTSAIDYFKPLLYGNL